MATAKGSARGARLGSAAASSSASSSTPSISSWQPTICTDGQEATPTTPTPQPLAPPAPPAPPSADEEAASPLGQALRRLRASAGPAYPRALETLCLIISNILEQPDEPKFRRLRLSNRQIQSRIRSLDGGPEALLALGFRQEGALGDAAAYVLDAQSLDAPLLRAAHARFDAARRRALDADRETRAAVAGLLAGAPPAVRAALDADAELRAAASAMVAHPLFGFLMGHADFRDKARAAVQDEAALRALLETFSAGRVERVGSREGWFDALLDNQQVVALFATKWCGPCKLLKPILAHLSQVPHLRSLKFVSVDCDELPQVAQEAGVSAFPTVKLYVDCREQESVVGGDVHKLVRILETAVGAGYSR